MKDKTYKLIGILLVIIVIVYLALFISDIRAYVSDTLTVQNNIAMGIVDIDLNEYIVQDGIETAYTGDAIVKPNEVLSNIPRITNTGKDCYVRAKVDFKGSENNLNLNDNNLKGINESWIKQGDYYYYTKVLQETQNVDIFTGIRVPAEWTVQSANMKYYVNIVAEAIQADNFIPDFNAENPWGDTKVQACAYSEHEK